MCLLTWGKELLARFESNRSVESLYGEDTDRDSASSRLPRAVNRAQHYRRELEFLKLTECVQRLGVCVNMPGCEISHLAIVPVIRQKQLRANADDAAIEEDHAAVVRDSLVQDWHPDIDQDILRQIAPQQSGERLPGVSVRVSLQEGVLAAVSRDLKLWTSAKSAPRGLRLFCMPRTLAWYQWLGKLAEL